MTQNTGHEVGLELERSWQRHIMIAGECGVTLAHIDTRFTEEEF